MTHHAPGVTILSCAHCFVFCDIRRFCHASQRDGRAQTEKG
jgi:hypothetical protein